MPGSLAGLHRESMYGEEGMDEDEDDYDEEMPEGDEDDDQVCAVWVRCV